LSEPKQVAPSETG
jgi:hypothetical protein